MFKKLNQFKEMTKIYKSLSKETIEIEAAGGQVKLTFNGAFQVTNVTVDPALLTADNKKTMEKAIKTIFEKGIQKGFKKIADNKELFAGMQGMPGMPDMPAE